MDECAYQHINIEATYMQLREQNRNNIWIKIRHEPKISDGLVWKRK